MLTTVIIACILFSLGIIILALKSDNNTLKDVFAALFVSAGFVILLSVISNNIKLLPTSDNNEKELYEITVVVYYPTNNDTITYKSNKEFETASDKGSNYILSNDEYYLETTAPIKIIDSDSYYE